MVEPTSLFTEAQTNEVLRRKLATTRGGGLNGGDGGDTSDGMNAWQSSVEGRLQALGGKIDAQLKWVLIAFASGFVLLAGLVINRTDSVREALSAKSDAISTDLRQTNERLARMEAVASVHGSAPAR